MGGDVCANSRLVECIDIGIAAIKHAIEFEDVAVGFRATEFIASSL